MGPVDFSLKYKVINDRSLCRPLSPFSTIAPDMSYLATVVTSFWKSQRFTCLFFWTLSILTLAYNSILTIAMWILTRWSRSWSWAVPFRSTSVLTSLLLIVYRLICITGAIWASTGCSARWAGELWGFSSTGCCGSSRTSISSLASLNISISKSKSKQIFYSPFIVEEIAFATYRFLLVPSF